MTAVICGLLNLLEMDKDPYQFAYSEGLGVDDAVLTLSHILHSHLDNVKTHARVL